MRFLISHPTCTWIAIDRCFISFPSLPYLFVHVPISKFFFLRELWHVPQHKDLSVYLLIWTVNLGWIHLVSSLIQELPDMDSSMTMGLANHWFTMITLRYTNRCLGHVEELSIWVPITIVCTCCTVFALCKELVPSCWYNLYFKIVEFEAIHRLKKTPSNLNYCLSCLCAWLQTIVSKVVSNLFLQWMWDDWIF